MIVCVVDHYSLNFLYVMWVKFIQRYLPIVELISDFMHLNSRTTLLNWKGQSVMDNSETPSTLDKRHRMKTNKQKIKNTENKKD